MSDKADGEGEVDADRADVAQKSPNDLGAALKSWWKRQHSIHVALTVVGSIATVVTLFITLHGFVTYISEAPARAEQSRLLQLQTVNAAWETIRTTKGSSSERGQTAAIKALIDSRVDLSGIDLGGTSVANADLQGGEFYRANLDRTHLIKVNISNGGLGTASANHSFFDTVTLDRVKGVPRSFDNALLFNSLLSTEIERGMVILADTSFREAVLIRTTIDLHGTLNFANACLAGVKFTLAHSDDDPDTRDAPQLSNADFSGATIAGGSFKDGGLHGADFRGARFITTAELWSSFDAILRAFNTDEAFDESAMVQLGLGGTTPSCMAHLTDLPNKLAIIVSAIGDVLTPAGSAGYQTSTAHLWLGDGRLATDFSGANLTNARLERANLRVVTGLSQAHVNLACVNEQNYCRRGFGYPSADVGKSNPM